MKVVLADLAHTYSVSDASLPIPLGIGYVAAYAKAVHGENIDITLFKHPELFLAHVLEQKPDLIGFANYGWNENLNRSVGDYLKPILKDTIFVSGGPNIDEDYQSQSDFLHRNRYLDYLIIDGGEEPFSELMTWIMDGKHPDDVPQNLNWLDESGTMQSQTARKLTKRIENIPSPYLSGVLDEFIDRGMLPLFETNRGCPFRCTFCAWGMASKDLVRRFDEDLAIREFDYVGARSRARNWIICDANFGILKRDVKLAKTVRAIKDKYGAPEKCHIWLAKNTTNRNLEIAEILGDMVVPVMAVQSLDDDVLKHINRDNINVNTYVEYQRKFHEIGHRTYSDVIVPLPQETLESHLDGLRQMFNFNVDTIQNHNLRLLAGAAINSRETRKEFGFKTRYRLIHGDAGSYRLPDGNEIRSFEYEESLRSTSTMSEEDMFFLRKLHFLVDFCWNIDTYKLLLKFGMKNAVSPVDVLVALIHANPGSGDTLAAGASGRLSEFWRLFDQASRGEWFDSAADIERYFEDTDNFQRLIGGDFDKLNILYAVIALRDFKPEFDAAMQDALGGLGPEATESLPEVMAIVQAVMPGLDVTEAQRDIDMNDYSDLAKQFLGDELTIESEIAFRAHPERQTIIDFIHNAERSGQTLSKVLNTQSFSLRSLNYTAEPLKPPEVTVVPSVIQKMESRRELGEV